MREGAPPLRAYWCGLCGGWHLAKARAPAVDIAARWAELAALEASITAADADAAVLLAAAIEAGIAAIVAYSPPDVAAFDAQIARYESTRRDRRSAIARLPLGHAGRRALERLQARTALERKVLVERRLALVGAT
jgi:hypothetical protein